MTVMAAPAPFSLLLPVYRNVDPDALRRAFDSSVDQQLRRPDEVVVVVDGPVPEPVGRAICELRDRTHVPVVVVPLPHHSGLAAALNAGLRACRHPVVARMDADDVSLPDRFAQQLPVIEDGADLVGAALLEFNEQESRIVGRRRPPTDPAVIHRTARLHDPFNHPTVVFRRDAVTQVGGYPTAVPMMEDYGLFARMIARGAQVANLPQPVVLYRVGEGAYSRRGGLALLGSELQLQWMFLRDGFVNPLQFTRNVLVRGVYRLVPETARRRLYRALVATRGERLDVRGAA